MKYSVDRIENDKIIVQNLETLQMEEISKDKIPLSVRDGDILKLENNTYQLDEAEKEKRKKRIQEKLNKLKQISNNWNLFFIVLIFSDDLLNNPGENKRNSSTTDCIYYDTDLTTFHLRKSRALQSLERKKVDYKYLEID